ncbi:golgin subfamily A member 6-like protein 6 [Takifugu flavidus]|uniref:golgin subfamily A member 6-like protein 6 n=1 Tax=Takifugu flavidus TaxID=433684 RepID=UPI00254415BD|nr:golgin subfamily A member 6-like protein 6 [Takifugu flavidus]
MERQLFCTEQHNRYLKDNLQQVKELMEKKDEEIASLQQQLDLSKSLNQTGEIQEELNGVDEQPRKVDIGLQINIPLRDISDSQELLNSEGNLEEETVHAETELMGRPRERPRDFEKPRSPENDLVPKERADWKKQLQELQEKCGKMERQLFYTEQHNRYLKDNLQQVKELMEKKDEEIASLQQQLDLSKSLNQTGEIQEELNGVDEQPRKVDIGLQINIPLRDISDSQELLNSEGNLEEEVGRPREVLQEREEQFRERSLRPEAHVDTLALLTQTEAALRESEEKSSRLEKELQEIVSEQGEKQLSRKKRVSAWSPVDQITRPSTSCTTSVTTGRTL